MRVEESIYIERQAEDVFAFYDDRRNDGRWMATVHESDEQARDELRECIQIAHELGDLPGMAMDLDRLGQVAALLGEPERACVLAGSADRLRRSRASR